MLNRSVAQCLACTGRTRKGCPSTSSRPSRRAPSVARVASSLKSQQTDRSLRPTTTSSGCWKRSDRPIVYPQAGACRSPNTYMPVQPSRSILACMPNMSWSSHVNESTLDPSFSLLLPSRMVGIVGWDERAFAASFDQRPALGGFQVVVMGTEAVEQLEQRELRLRPVLTVIVLEEGDAVAALDRTSRIEPRESALLVRIGTSTEVRHPHHLAAFRDDRSEERIARVEQIPDRRNRDRPVAGDLTDLVAGGGPAEQPGEVDAHQQLRPGTAPLLHVIRALYVAGKLDHRVGRVCLERLPPAFGAGHLEQLVADGLERGHDLGDDLGVVSQEEVPGPLGVTPGTQAPPLVDAAPPRLEVGDRGLGAGALVG